MSNVFLWVGILTGLFAFTSVFASDDKRVKLVSIGVMALLYWQLTAWQDKQPKDDGFGAFRVACMKKFFRERTANVDEILNYNIQSLSGAYQDYRVEIALEAKVGPNIRVNCLFDEETGKVKDFRIYPN